MKKFVKFSLIGITYLIVIFFLAIMFIVTAKAELIKPSIEIEPDQVVKIQLNGLMNNDQPNSDYGIKQTWEFAHPLNKKSTGQHHRFELAQHAVRAPVASQINCGSPNVPGIGFEFRFESLEQCQRVGRAAGEAHHRPVSGDETDFLGAHFHHRIPDGHLAVGRHCDTAVF